MFVTPELLKPHAEGSGAHGQRWSTMAARAQNGAATGAWQRRLCANFSYKHGTLIVFKFELHCFIFFKRVNLIFINIELGCFFYLNFSTCHRVKSANRFSHKCTGPHIQSFIHERINGLISSLSEVLNPNQNTSYYNYPLFACFLTLLIQKKKQGEEKPTIFSIHQGWDTRHLVILKSALVTH